MTSLARWITDEGLGHISGRQESNDRKFCGKRFHSHGSHSTPVHKVEELKPWEEQQIARARARLDPGPLPL